MLESLTVLNLPAGTRIEEALYGDVFTLKTCQRTLILGFHQAPIKRVLEKAEIEEYQGPEAYQFLLETISGLKSQVLGEYEVVGQFKRAYQEYLTLSFKQSQIIQVMEKLFKDSKEIRSLFLTEIGQLSYAGIARKILHRDITSVEFEDGEEPNVLILGTGDLSEDLIKLLKKKNKITVSGRNTTRLEFLRVQYDIEVVEWDNKKEFAKASYIVNTIGSNEIVFNDEFFLEWKENSANGIFIDLGSPSIINSKLKSHDGLIRLEDIFKESAKLTNEKMEKINKAHAHICYLVEKRKTTFIMTNRGGWEEFHFA